MSKTKNKENKLEFNTYCIFTNEEQNVNQIGRLKAKTK